MIGPTAQQRALFAFICAYMAKHGIAPSFDEMREPLALKSKSGIHRLLAGLEERGYIRRLYNRARAIEIVNTPGERVARLQAQRGPLSSDAALLACLNLHQVDWLKQHARNEGTTPEALLREIVDETINAVREDERAPTPHYRREAHK